MTGLLDRVRELFSTKTKDYPDTCPEGLENYQFSPMRIQPILNEIPDGSIVLDVGCNSGEMIKWLKEHKKCKIYGVDKSKTCIKLCKKKNLNVILIDSDVLPFDTGSFDFVLLCETFEHIENPIKMLKEIKRVLKPNGILLGSSPHRNTQKYIWHDERESHRQYYSEIELTNDLRTAFNYVDIKSLEGRHWNMKMANSHLSNIVVEMLFKASDGNLNSWEYLIDRKGVFKIFMVPTLSEGVSYYRMYGFGERMRKEKKVDVAYPFNPVTLNGTEVHVSWIPRMNQKHVLGPLTQLVEMADVSVWQLFSHPLGCATIAAFKKKFKKPIVTEVDDLLTNLPAYNIASHPYRPGSDAEYWALDQIKMSDHIVVSTPYLKQMMEKINKNITVIPNSIDFKVYDSLKTPKKDDKIRILYTGCANHKEDMELIKKPILRLLEEFKNLEFISVLPFWENEVKHDRIKYCNLWVPIESVPEFMSSLNPDIGVAPLLDNHFNRAKSNLRYLEYSGLKIPTVASPVMPFKESITHGLNGYLAFGEEEWYLYLKDLVLSQFLRKEIGKEAYNNVKKHWDVDDVAEQYLTFLRSIT